MIYLFALLNFIHPIYISNSSIMVDENHINIKIKIFRDDFEDALRVYHGNSISIDTNDKLLKNKVFVSQYLNNKFILKINENNKNIIISDLHLINDVLEIESSFKIDENITNFKIKNELLFDVYSIQKNILFLLPLKKRGHH